MNNIIDTTETPTTLTIPKILSTEEVLQVLNISRATLYRGIKAGIYLKPFKRSAKLNGWYACDMAIYLKQHKF